MDNASDPFVVSQLSLILESSSVNIFTLDGNHRYAWFNRVHAKVMKEIWGVELAVGMDFLEAVIQDDQDRAKAQTSFDRVLAGEELLLVEAFGNLPDRRLFENRYSPTRLENGEIAGVTVFAVDVTERVQLAEERVALDRMLLESSQLESLGLMVGCVAHDFNNLLVPILLSAEMAKSATDAVEPIGEYLDTIVESTKSAADLTKQLLNFSNNGNASQELLDLNELIRGATELAKVSVRRRARLKITLTEQQLLAWANPAQMRQVILNLLINASEATHGPHPRVEIETSTLRVTGAVESQVICPERVAIGDYAVVTVIDNGCGMTGEQLSQIFEPFYSTKGTGRGLGLTAIQGILRSHRGFLAIESSAGRGSIFRVGVPLASASVAEISEQVPDPQMVAESSASSMRLLIADDNERVLNCLEGICKRLGHDVVTASCGIRAIVAATSGVFDLILLDANMMDVGYEEILKAIPSSMSTPVALMSGEVHDAALVANPRVHSVLVKPFTIESLLSLLVRFKPRASSYSKAMPVQNVSDY